MRSLHTSHELVEKQQKQGRFLLIFMLTILVVSSIGYAFLSNPDTSSENEQQAQSGFQEAGGEWVVIRDGQQLVFTYAPEAVTNVSLALTMTLNSYYQQQVYYVTESAALPAELQRTLALYTGRMQEACLGSCATNLPEKNCSSLLIVWNQSGENQVTQEDRCVFIQGDLRAVDAFLYHLFGIGSA